jgi:hypothetical protein
VQSFDADQLKGDAKSALVLDLIRLTLFADITVTTSTTETASPSRRKTVGLTIHVD